MWFRRRRKERDSQLALERAQDDLKRTKERSPEVSELAQASKSLRETNHFTEQLRTLMPASAAHFR